MNKQGNNDEKDFNPETHFVLTPTEARLLARLGFQSFKTFKSFNALKSEVTPKSILDFVAARSQ
jgi:hypothetical protein